MTSVKRFWLWAIALSLLVIAVLASTIWQTSPAQQKTIIASEQSASEGSEVEGSEEKSLQSLSNSTPSSVDSKPDASFPAPAKKLHKVIADTEAESEAQDKLQQQTQKLDEQLAALNQQLREKGIAVPENQAQPSTASNDDTAKRLDAIKQHIENKKTQ